MDKTFRYLRAEDPVPRDAVHVIIGGSVKVVPPGACKGCRNLRTVEILEGVEVIGAFAFADCPNLTRLDASRASSLRSIGWGAFAGCCRLLELILCEGLEEIGEGAFYKCALGRISVPSSVVEIGRRAFAGCERLSDVLLREGLRRIREKAFRGCALERITVPSSVVEIGEYAFESCNNLEAVTLAGGMVMVAGDAFQLCYKLRNIATPSEAIVVEDGEDGSGRAAVETAVTIVGPVWDDNAGYVREPTRLILTSPYLASMSSEDIERAKDAINRIAGGQPPGEGPLDLAVGDGAVATEDDWIRVREGADRIRARFLGLLSAHRREMASNVLEHALERAVAGIISSFLPDIEG